MIGELASGLNIENKLLTTPALSLREIVAVSPNGETWKEVTLFMRKWHNLTFRVLLKSWIVMLLTILVDKRNKKEHPYCEDKSF